MIKILDTEFNRIANVKRTTSSTCVEGLNGEHTLDFATILDEKTKELIGDNSIFELNNDYFDISYYKKTVNEDGSHSIEIQSDHISYRLSTYDHIIEYFARTGTPEFILSQILEGTIFSVGTVEFTDNITYSAQEAKSRRQLLMELAAYVGGEIVFDKLKVNIVTHIGSTEINSVLKDRNVKVISKALDKRTLDENGNPTVSYECTPMETPENGYSLGDEVLLVQNAIGVKERLRVIQVKYDPYDQSNKTYVFANYVDGLEDSLYKIATSSVIKDKIYNGCRIGPEYGFECVRSDKMARSYFSSDKFAMQVGDGTGEVWVDQVYYDPSIGKYVFDGTLSTHAIEGIAGELDLSGFVTFHSLEDLSDVTTINGGYITSAHIETTSGKIAGFTFTEEDPETNNGGFLYNNPELGKYIRISPFSVGDGEGGYDTDYGGISLGLSDDRKNSLLFLRSDGYARFGLVSENGVSIRFNDFLRYDKGIEGATNTILYSKNFKINRDGTVDGTFDGGGGGTGGSGFPVGGYTGQVLGKLSDTDNDVGWIDQTGDSDGSGGEDNIWVQPEPPTEAKENDVWIDTDDYTRYDKTALVTTTTLTIDSNEFITASGTFSIILHSATVVGVIKKIFNIGTGLITIEGAINGNKNMYLYPNESVELITDGTGWRY